MNISSRDKNKRIAGQFGKFMAVGVMNFLVDFGVFKLLSVVFGVPVVISNIISYTCGVINSFIVNRYWTFKIKHKFVSVHFLKFVFVNLISLGVNTLAVWVLSRCTASIPVCSASKTCMQNSLLLCSRSL